MGQIKNVNIDLEKDEVPDIFSVIDSYAITVESRIEFRSFPEICIESDPNEGNFILIRDLKFEGYHAKDTIIKDVKLLNSEPFINLIKQNLKINDTYT